MTYPRRITSFTLLALVTLCSSVFLLPQKASALEPTNSLVQNKVIVEQQKEKLELKANELKSTKQQIEEIEAKKQDLSEQLETAKAEVDSLSQKLEEKKAAAEAEKQRLAKIRAMFVRVTSYASNSAGNTYAPGNCTWYAKSKRPDLPNNLGNANTWYQNAAAQGFNVGTAPKKGAIAQAINEMHVAYVEGVSLDGSTVTISEMNYGGLYRMNTRTVPASQFIYIYEKA